MKNTLMHCGPASITCNIMQTCNRILLSDCQINLANADSECMLQEAAARRRAAQVRILHASLPTKRRLMVPCHLPGFPSYCCIKILNWLPTGCPFTHLDIWKRSIRKAENVRVGGAPRPPPSRREQPALIPTGISFRNFHLSSGSLARGPCAHRATNGAIRAQLKMQEVPFLMQWGKGGGALLTAVSVIR